MKIYVLVLLATAGFFGTLLPSQDPQFLVFRPNQSYDPNQSIAATQPITDQNGQQCANIVGEIQSLSKLYYKNDDIVAVNIINNTTQVLDKSNIWKFDRAKQKFEPTTQQINVINKKNLIESASDLISKLVHRNVWVAMLSMVGCSRSIGCVVWAMGTPVFTPYYVGSSVLCGICSSGMLKVTDFYDKDENKSLLSTVCVMGLLLGMAYRY